MTTPGGDAGTSEERVPPGSAVHEPSSATDALYVIDTQRSRAERAFFGTPVPLLLAWGVTWLLGFGIYFFASFGGHFVPTWAAGSVLAVLGAAATAVSVVQFAHQRQGLRGPSPAMAIRYAWSWPIGVVAVAAFDSGLDHQGLSPSVASILWPASFVIVAGLLYLAGGVIFGDNVMFALGTWTLAIAAASTFASVPGCFAVLSLGGGGGLLAAAIVLQPRFRPASRAG